MKIFIILSTLSACVIAKPSYFHGPLTFAAGPIIAAPLGISSQYHTQDSLGQYSYGYSEPLSAKSESRSLDGVTRGGYSYVDANGEIQTVQYTADAANGFRVSGSNLPVAPESETLETPAPVQDTAEVAKAKAEHLAAVEEAKQHEQSSGSVESDVTEEAVESESTDDGSEVSSESTVGLDVSETSSVASDTASDAGEVSATVPTTTTSVPLPAVSTYVHQPVSYYSYAALAPAYHYKAIVPAFHAYGYGPFVYGGIPLDTFSAHLKANAHVFSSRTIIH